MRYSILILSIVFSMFNNIATINTNGSFVYKPSQNETSSLQTDIPIIPESNDFATRVLNDPWDMNEFTDVSQWLNHAGSSNELLNLSVNNGVFSATTEGNYSEFYPLFPGYSPGLLHGKIGALYPIQSNTYKCLYLNIQTNKTSNFQVFYAKDRGFVSGIDPNTSGRAYTNATASNYFKLYKMDLTAWQNTIDKKWSDLSMWQVLKINPTWLAGTSFQYDWIRLTDCNPVNFNISGLSANGNYDIWLGVGSPERSILVELNITANGSGGYSFDTQGLEANIYTYYVKNANSSTIVKQGQFIVNSSPEIEFVSPSPTSGEDFATTAGNPWDMSGADDMYDANAIRCMGYSFENGIVNMYTNSSQCPGGDGEADPIYFLSKPNGAYARPSDYRYLSFRMYQNGLEHGVYSYPDHGMVVRWIWMASGCDNVSREVALDIGWHTYTVDLFNDYNGTPIASECDPNKLWENYTAEDTNFRFDPNENLMGFQFQQQLDWIKLTKVESSQIGRTFAIRYIPSEENLQSLEFYYTTDLNNPTQHPAIEKTNSGIPSPLNGPNFIYLPLVLNNAQQYNTPIFNWDTNGVNAGEYYICAVMDDGYNQVTNCSEAPVKLY